MLHLIIAVLMAVLSPIALAAEQNSAKKIETESRQRKAVENKGLPGQKRKSDDVPSFRAIKRLESLSASQRKKVEGIMDQAKDDSLQMMRRLKEIKEETGGRLRSSPEGLELRDKIHEIRKKAWLKIQKSLTAKQKAELIADSKAERGPGHKRNRGRKHDSMEMDKPTVFDSSPGQ